MPVVVHDSKRWNIFNCGYFVRLANGELVPSRRDWGLHLGLPKAGDSLGVKNEREGIVLCVVEGEMARHTGFDVMIIVEERIPTRAALDQPWKNCDRLTESSYDGL